VDDAFVDLPSAMRMNRKPPFTLLAFVTSGNDISKISVVIDGSGKLVLAIVPGLYRVKVQKHLYYFQSRVSGSQVLCVASPVMTGSANSDTESNAVLKLSGRFVRADRDRQAAHLDWAISGIEARAGSSGESVACR
jgi:hypothetical protein